MKKVQILRMLMHFSYVTIVAKNVHFISYLIVTFSHYSFFMFFLASFKMLFAPTLYCSSRSDTD